VIEISQTGQSGAVRRARVTHEAAIRDGVYELFYKSQRTADPSWDTLLLIMRQGHLLGADRWGGIIIGTCEFDPSVGRHKFTVTLDVPADGLLVTGAAAPSASQTIEFVAQLNGQTYSTAGTIELFGEAVAVELVYRGPVHLPKSSRSAKR
jgi:hypothetical protein